MAQWGPFYDCPHCGKKGVYHGMRGDFHEYECRYCHRFQLARSDREALARFIDSPDTRFVEGYANKA